MALDQPGVGVSSAENKFIARVTRTPSVRTASVPGPANYYFGGAELRDAMMTARPEAVHRMPPRMPTN
jgi:hypothetical protein